MRHHRITLHLTSETATNDDKSLAFDAALEVQQRVCAYGLFVADDAPPPAVA